MEIPPAKRHKYREHGDEAWAKSHEQRSSQHVTQNTPSQRRNVSSGASKRKLSPTEASSSYIQDQACVVGRQDSSHRYQQTYSSENQRVGNDKYGREASGFHSQQRQWRKQTTTQDPKSYAGQDQREDPVSGAMFQAPLPPNESFIPPIPPPLEPLPPLPNDGESYPRQVSSLS